MKSLRLFGLTIPWRRQRQESSHLIGARAQLKGRKNASGIITSVRWFGLRITIAAEVAPRKPHAFETHLPRQPKGRKAIQPRFHSAWRWNVQVL